MIAVSFLSRLFGKKKQEPERFLQAIQVEISSICDAHCTFCPTAHLKDGEEPQFMPLETYQKLVPYFTWPRWVYLQGWGEPFLHPHLWEMVRLAKEQGAKVGLTTNGAHFTPENIQALFQHGVDLVSVSLAGATPATHNRVRAGTDLERILAGIKEIVREKKNRKSKEPTIKVSYMLTKDTAAELPQAVKTAYELGVNEFYCTNLDYVFDEATDQSKVFVYSGDPDPEVERYVSQARRFANDKNYIFDCYPLKAKEEQLAFCEQNPVNFIFITAGGEVTCCPYLARSRNPRYGEGRLTEIPRKSFGNIQQQTLEEIWLSEPYTSFRHVFGARTAAYQELMEVWGDAEPSLIVFQESEAKYQAAMKANPLPPECSSCHKAYGL